MSRFVGCKRDAAGCSWVPSRLPFSVSKPLYLLFGILQFLDALDLMATKRGQPLAEVVAQVAGSAGPEAHCATQGEWVKLHDDRTTYTGKILRREDSSMTCQPFRIYLADVR